MQTEYERIDVAEIAGEGTETYGEIDFRMTVAEGTSRPMIATTEDAAMTIGRERFEGLTVEEFWVVYLDGKNRAIATRMVSRGSLTASIVHPREVFRPAVVVGADAVVLFHNHPSGDPEPSAEDMSITHRIAQAGQLLGIRVLDHIIFGRGSSRLSFHERGLIDPDFY